MGATETDHSQQAANAALVASELHAAGKLAQKLSLVAKNARTLVVKAGNTAQGLKVITEHFSDLADQTIALTKLINTLAVNITKASVLGWKSDNVCQRMAKAKLIAKNAMHVLSLDDAASKNLAKSEELKTQFLTMVSEMDIRLEEIRSFMRSTDVISVSFKLEAIQTGKHEKILTALASEITTLSNGIKYKIQKSTTLMAEREATRL